MYYVNLYNYRYLSVKHYLSIYTSVPRSGHENVVDMMLNRGAPISAKTKNGLAPLHMSSQVGLPLFMP